MRRSLPSIGLAIAVALVLALPGSGSATAKPKPTRATVNDKAGDAPAQIDLLQGKYVLTKKGASFEVRVKQLSETTFLAFEVHPLSVGWDRLAIYRENGRTVGKLYYIDTEEEITPYLSKCPGLKLSWSSSADTVTAFIPMGCMQASASASPGEHGFEVHSRIGGVKNSPGDSIKAVDLFL